jgi:dihydroflavonol-4-reductase
MPIAFITGATGFVGSHLVDLLLENGFKVKCLARTTSNMRWLKDKNVEIIDGSLNNLDSLKMGVADVDYVFHLAGVLFGRNPESFTQGNIQGTKNLLEAVKQVNPKLKRFLHCSSQTVAGPAINLESVIDETMEPNPLTWYGKSKLEAEKLVNNYAQFFPITIVRPGAVYGPRDYAIFEVFKTSLSGFNLAIGSKEKFVSFIYIDDLVAGIIQAAQSDKTIGETYFIVGDDISKQDEISRLAIKEYGKKVKTIRVPHAVLKLVAKTSDIIGNIIKKDMILNSQKFIELKQDFWIATNAKAKKDFNFSPKWTLESGVKASAKWYKDNGWINY